MVVRDGAAIRKERIGLLMNMIQKHQDETDWTINRTIGIFMLQTGLTRLKIKEYIQELIDLGFCAEMAGNLKWNGSII